MTSNLYNTGKLNPGQYSGVARFVFAPKLRIPPMDEQTIKSVAEEIERFLTLDSMPKGQFREAIDLLREGKTIKHTREWLMFWKIIYPKIKR